MFQEITIVGNLGGAPEMRYTPSGVPVANFNVATSRKFTDANGNPQEKTIWFRVAAWRKQAETVSQYLTKGSKVLVIGEMEEPKPFTDKSGTMRASLEVTARTIKFLSSRGDNSNGSATSAEPAGEDDSPEGQVPF